MKAKLLLLLIACCVSFSCKKDKFESKPALVLKDIKTYLLSSGINQGSAVEIEMEVNDKEGDVNDSIYIQKIDAASIPCPDNSILSNLNYKIPSYPSGDTRSVIFRLKFATFQASGYGLISGPQCSPRKDTSLFKIWVSDRKGNTSDTLVTRAIAIP
ncbi:MAG: hypothetical protein KGP35_07045 [Bacteroidetes bacterium]|nr:hypothetical protein [Bacteroidota bacterium]